VRLGLLLGLASIVGFYAGDIPDLLRRQELMWLASLSLGVCAFAVASPDPLVGLAVAWIALHPWWNLLGFLWGVVPDMVRNGDLYRNLWPVGGWTAVYLLAGHGLTAAGLRVLAIVWVGWALLNALAIGYQSVIGQIPGYVVVTEGMPRAGLSGGSWFCSYGLCLGVLSAVFLGGVWLVSIPLFLLACVPAKNFMAPIAMMIALFALVPPSMLVVPALGGVVLVATKVHGRHRAMGTRWQRWLLASGFVWLAKGWGTGLGSLARMQFRDHSEDEAKGVYNNLHNDWLQALIELGPFPVLCALAEVVRRIVWLPAGPEYAFVLALVLFTGVLAFAYFPVHHPSQAMVLALAMGYR